MKLDSSAI